MNDPRRVEAALAHNLREWRTRRGWSQAELATRAGLSKGMLVQIEQSQTNPSIATLCKLANALGVALPRLVEVADEPVIRRVTAEEVAWLWRGHGRGSGAGLVGGIETPMPVELWEWRMGPRDVYEALAHPAGTREIVYALEGRVSVIVEGVEMTIATGECAVFHADRPHRYAAAEGRPARFMMVVVEPLQGPTRASSLARVVSRQKAKGTRQKQKAQGTRQKRKAQGTRQKRKAQGTRQKRKARGTRA
ncbi:MAG TPA: XRE family transcriptional regulator, partial [Vicinamibacterales bacterium]|nr:XRE family transcriptional regulator [Vicinamibacterales bacterium]